MREYHHIFSRVLSIMGIFLGPGEGRRGPLSAYFFKITFLKNSFRNTIRVKQFGSRSGLTFCQGSKLFTKVISRRRQQTKNLFISMIFFFFFCNHYSDLILFRFNNQQLQTKYGFLEMKKDFRFEGIFISFHIKFFSSCLEHQQCSESYVRHLEQERNDVDLKFIFSYKSIIMIINSLSAITVS